MLAWASRLPPRAGKPSKSCLACSSLVGSIFCQALVPTPDIPDRSFGHPPTRAPFVRPVGVGWAPPPETQDAKRGKTRIVAARVGYRKSKIDGEAGLWQYVPYAHKNTLDRVPDPGVIVAQTVGKSGALVRASREAKAPRKRPVAM